MRLISNDGITVFVPTGRSHLDQHKDALQFLNEAVGMLGLNCINSGMVCAEVDMGRIIGKTACVQTDDSDDIVYHRRHGRNTMTRFVTTREMMQCQHMSLILKRQPDSFLLVTAYIGKLSEREPDDVSIITQEDFLRSKAFWDSHALVFGSQQIRK